MVAKVFELGLYVIPVSINNGRFPELPVTKVRYLVAFVALAAIATLAAFVALVALATEAPERSAVSCVAPTVAWSCVELIL